MVDIYCIFNKYCICNLIHWAFISCYVAYLWCLSKCDIIQLCCTFMAPALLMKIEIMWKFISKIWYVWENYISFHVNVFVDSIWRSRNQFCFFKEDESSYMQCLSERCRVTYHDYITIFDYEWFFFAGLTMGESLSEILLLFVHLFPVGVHFHDIKCI